jgi:hypothetical protein
MRLDREHQLAQKLGIPGDRFLRMAGEKLGVGEDFERLLTACVGGKFNAEPSP